MSGCDGRCPKVHPGSSSESSLSPVFCASQSPSEHSFGVLAIALQPGIGQAVPAGLCPSLPRIQRGRGALGKAPTVALIVGWEGRQQEEQSWLFFPLPPEPRGCQRQRKDPGLPRRIRDPQRDQLLQVSRGSESCSPSGTLRYPQVPPLLLPSSESRNQGMS